MAASFPGIVKVFSTKVAGVDLSRAQHINDLQDEVVAIEDFLINKAAAENIFKLVYPIGSIYTSVVNTNPGTLFGGTWVAFGSGRVLVGVDAADTDFNTVKKTGGTKAHNHPLSDLGVAKVAVSTAGSISTAHTPNMPTWTAARKITGTYGTDTGTYTSGAGLLGKTDDGNSLQPYITVYMWERTA